MMMISAGASGDGSQTRRPVAASRSARACRIATASRSRATACSGVVASRPMHDSHGPAPCPARAVWLCGSGQPRTLASPLHRGAVTVSDCLTVCVISCLVYARLHVNARTRAVRQTLRQIRNVAMKGGGYSDTPPQEPERQLPDARRTSIASWHRAPPSASAGPSGQAANLSRAGRSHSVVPTLSPAPPPRKPHPSCLPRLTPNAPFVPAQRGG